MKERPILFSSETEKWEPIPGEVGRYEVSNLGNVRTLSKRIPKFFKKTLSPWETSRGYLSVTLKTREGKNKSWSVHRLVMAAFIGPCPVGMQVAHNDGDRKNNTLSNLRYATPSSNIDDRRRHGRTARGSRQGNSKLDEAAVKTILKLRESGLSAAEIAHLSCVNTSVVVNIWGGKAWTHVN